ncbi:PIN domain-containing protein [Cecembia sp.]|uniref:PIN domain-containing protein n=1 Tax=Cecembia sp. TaxID=1898110 RepID=UPI0025C0A059|nr:PIN domain-containing protein [Cecembia sp.]
MKEALLDTDTLINFFKKDTETLIKTKKCLSEFDVFSISDISYFEFLKGLEFRGSLNKKIIFDIFVEENKLIRMSKESIKISASVYADLRKQGITIGTADLLIAGIAIHSDMELITNNQAHFRQIKDLKLNNWK